MVKGERRQSNTSLSLSVLQTILSRRKSWFIFSADFSRVGGSNLKRKKGKKEKEKEKGGEKKEGRKGGEKQEL